LAASDDTYRLALDGRFNPAIDTDEEHDNSLGGASPQKTASTPERVGKKCEEDQAADDFDDTVDASREEGDQVTAQTERLEDLRSVVVLAQG